MNRIREWLASASNALRKLAHGLPLGEERVWEGVRNDLFVAHLSIYRFFAQFTRGATVLDAGCGTGYGAEHLRASGARTVLGIDVNEKAIRYARRTYRRDHLTFRVHDCMDLVGVTPAVQVITCSNTMEHLHDPRLFLGQAREILDDRGSLLIAVPPNLTPHDLADNAANPHHLTNLSVQEWTELFTDLGWTYRLYAHTHPQVMSMNFHSSCRSTFRPEDFQFLVTDSSSFASDRFSLSAVFKLHPAKG